MAEFVDAEAVPVSTRAGRPRGRPAGSRNRQTSTSPQQQPSVPGTGVQIYEVQEAGNASESVSDNQEPRDSSSTPNSANFVNTSISANRNPDGGPLNAHVYQ
jgi:hypothetical protein